MRKLFTRYCQHLITNLIWLGISIIIGVGIFLLYFFLNERIFLTAANALVLSGVCLTSFGLLIMVTKLGAFDTFIFGFKQLGGSVFNRNISTKETFLEYKEKMYVNRGKSSIFYVSIILVGVIFLIIGAIFSIITLI